MKSALIAAIVTYGILSMSGCQSTEAAEISVEPRATVHFFDDFDNAIGVGAQLHVNDIWSDLFKEGDQIRVSSGFEVLQTEGKTKRSVYHGKREITYQLDPEVVIANTDIAYVHPVTESLDIYINGGIDFWFAGNDGDVQIDNTVGGHIGAGAHFKATEDVGVTGGFYYQFAETDVDVGRRMRTSSEVDLDNVVVYIGGNIRL